MRIEEICWELIFLAKEQKKARKGTKLWTAKKGTRIEAEMKLKLKLNLNLNGVGYIC